MYKNKKYIIFDFGGVLYDIDMQRTIDALSALSQKPEIFTNFKISELINFSEDFEKGEISSEIFINKLRKKLYLSADDNKIINAWNKMLIAPAKESIEVLKTLKKEYFLILLSNTNELHFNYFYPTSKSIFDLMDKIYLSYEMHLRKPDTKIFTHILKENNINENNVIFIDDSLININSAKKSGIKSIHFINLKLSDLVHTV